MSDISKINVDGVDYDVKDATIRNMFPNDKVIVNTTEEIDPAIQQVFSNMNPEDVRVVKFWTTSEDVTPLWGGLWWMLFLKMDDNNGAVIAISYRQNVRVFKKVSIKGEWSNWISFEGTFVE